MSWSSITISNVIKAANSLNLKAELLAESNDDRACDEAYRARICQIV